MTTNAGQFQLTEEQLAIQEMAQRFTADAIMVASKMFEAPMRAHWVRNVSRHLSSGSKTVDVIPALTLPR